MSATYNHDRLMQQAGYCPYCDQGAARQCSRPPSIGIVGNDLPTPLAKDQTDLLALRYLSPTRIWSMLMHGTGPSDALP